MYNATQTTTVVDYDNLQTDVTVHVRQTYKDCNLNVMVKNSSVAKSYPELAVVVRVYTAR